MRVLLSAERLVPMPAVDLHTVQQNCRVAVLETLLRDLAALGVLTAAVILQPLGTLIAVLLFLVPLMATARRKVPSGVPIGIALGILLAVTAVNPSPSNLFFAPVIAFGALFLIATADMLWSAHRVRVLWRQTPAAPTRMPGSNVVYYNKHGFIGSGVASSAFPLTVPLDKAKDKTKPVHGVTAAKLLAYIGSHLATQGVSDGQPHGYAHDPAAAPSLPAEPTPADDDDASPRHFTYGLPYLDIDQVVAVPLPPLRKVPFTRFSRLSLKYAEHPAAADMHRTVDKSPSDFPYRHYIRAITASWDGQLVVSVFVSAALQGHFLQVVIRPYLIAPIGADLKAADSLVGRPRVALVLSCLAMNIRQFLRAAESLGGIARGGLGKADSADPEPVKPGLLSIRERYAQPAVDHIYHSEDAARLITVMEEKVIRATMRYLDICNVDVIETESRIMNTFVQNTINGAGNIVVDSTISQSTMTATSGQGNTTTNGSGGSGSP